MPGSSRQSGTIKKKKKRIVWVFSSDDSPWVDKSLRTQTSNVQPCHTVHSLKGPVCKNVQAISVLFFGPEDIEQDPHVTYKSSHI